MCLDLARPGNGKCRHPVRCGSVMVASRLVVIGAFLVGSRDCGVGVGDGICRMSGSMSFEGLLGIYGSC